MILPYNTHPESSLYYNAAMILQALPRSKKINIMKWRREDMNIQMIPYASFILALDFLFLMGVVDITQNKEIIYVSKESKN